MRAGTSVCVVALGCVAATACGARTGLTVGGVVDAGTADAASPVAWTSCTRLVLRVPPTPLWPEDEPVDEWPSLVARGEGLDLVVTHMDPERGYELVARRLTLSTAPPHFVLGAQLTLGAVGTGYPGVATDGTALGVLSTGMPPDRTFALRIYRGADSYDLIDTFAGFDPRDVPDFGLAFHGGVWAAGLVRFSTATDSVELRVSDVSDVPAGGSLVASQSLVEGGHGMQVGGLLAAYGHGVVAATTNESPYFDLTFLRDTQDVVTTRITTPDYAVSGLLVEVASWPFDAHAAAVAWETAPDTSPTMFTTHLLAVRDDGTTLVEATAPPRVGFGVALAAATPGLIVASLDLMAGNHGTVQVAIYGADGTLRTPVARVAALVNESDGDGAPRLRVATLGDAIVVVWTGTQGSACCDTLTTYGAVFGCS